MLVLMLILNFAISWFNCYSCGRMWNESKALGGFPRVLAWCGAIQAAIGFSSVFGFLIGFVLHITGYLPVKVANAAEGLWYLMVIIPLLGTGLIITIEFWIIAFRERSLLNMGAAAYNTFAQLHNMYGAIDGIGKAFGMFEDLLNDDHEDGGSGMIWVAIVLTVLSILSGVVLACVLIQRYAGTIPLPTPVWLRKFDEKQV